jgi:hypothetical protein
LNLIYATILEFQNYEKIIWLLSIMKDWEKFLYTLSCSYQLSWRNFVKRPIHAERLDLSRNFPILQPGQFLIVVTRKSQTVWSQKINHRKAEKVTYQIGIQSWNFVSTGCCSVQNRFQQFIDAQNSVTSKPLVG